MACAYRFRRGINAGKSCCQPIKPGSDLCSAHAKRVLQLDELPALVHAAIVDCIVTTYAPAAAYARLVLLSRTSRYWHATITARWDALYRRMRTPADNEVSMAAYSRVTG